MFPYLYFNNVLLETQFLMYEEAHIKKFSPAYYFHSFLILILSQWTFIIAYILLTKFHVIVLVVKALSMPELLYCFAWDVSNPKELVTFGEMLSSVCMREEEDWMKLSKLIFFAAVCAQECWDWSLKFSH